MPLRSRKGNLEARIVTRNDDVRSPVKETLASSIYEALRRDILDMALPAGSKLNIKALCERFQVGLSPVREALSRLATERLVTQFDHRGFAVAPLSIDDLRDLTRARIAIDGQALRLSIAEGGPAWEEGLLIAYHWLSRTPRTRPDNSAVRSEKWESLHREYHRALIAGCNSKWMLDFSNQLFEASNRYRHASRLMSRDRSKTDEHKEIMEAALEQNADLAVSRLAAHYTLTADLVEMVLSDVEPHE
jgi:GntR family carbon starvation induced transcriptional regulator